MLSINIVLVCKLGVYEVPTVAAAAEVTELVVLVEAPESDEVVVPVEKETVPSTVLSSILEFKVSSKALGSGIKL
jgi:hypothetical protein